jgi:hypothetical protein
MHFCMISPPSRARRTCDGSRAETPHEARRDSHASQNAHAGAGAGAGASNYIRLLACTAHSSAASQSIHAKRMHLQAASRCSTDREFGTHKRAAAIIGHGCMLHISFRKNMREIKRYTLERRKKNCLLQYASATVITLVSNYHRNARITVPRALSTCLNTVVLFCFLTGYLPLFSQGEA